MVCLHHNENGQITPADTDTRFGGEGGKPVSFWDTNSAEKQQIAFDEISLLATKPLAPDHLPCYGGQRSNSGIF